MRYITSPLPALLFALCTGAVMAGTVVTDQNGRRVNIPQRVDRIVTLVIPGAAMATAVDLGSHRLAGIHPAARREIVDGVLGRMMPETKKIPANMAGDGFVPNVEAILAARPDIVIQWGDKGDAIVDPIAALGVPVMTLRYGNSELAAEWLQLMGMALTGRETRGVQLASHFLSVREEVAQAAAFVPEGSRPKVLYLYRAHGNAFQVAGRKTSMDSDIRLAGGINVAGDLPGFAQISIEQLLAWSPDVILLNNFEKGMRPTVIFGNRLLASLSAARERRVYLYPLGGFRWDPPSHESPLAWRWLLTIFHPEMKTTSLRKEIMGSYRMLYGFTPDSGDIDQILRMADNGESRHYQKKFGRTKGGL